MTKYKVNINRPKISTEEIIEQKDFNIVLKKYKKHGRPLFKTNWMVIYTLILIVLITVFIAVRIIRRLENDSKEKKEVIDPHLRK